MRKVEEEQDLNIGELKYLDCWVLHSILSLYHLESVALLSLIGSLYYITILWVALVAASRRHLDRWM